MTQGLQELYITSVGGGGGAVRRRYDAYVAADGTADYTLLSDACNALPANSTIYVRGIVYESVDVVVKNNQKIYSWDGGIVFSGGSHFVINGSGFYNTGLATINQNSFTVNGIGTLWVANISPGYKFVISGSVFTVANVVSDTQLTLVERHIGSLNSNTIQQEYFAGNFASGVIIEGLYVTGSTNVNGAFYFDIATDCFIRPKKVYGNALGINISRSYLNTIRCEDITDNIDGIKFQNNSRYNTSYILGIHSNVNDGIIFDNYAKFNTVYVTYINGNSNGIYAMNNSEYNTVFPSYIEHNNDSGVRFESDRNTIIDCLRISNNNLYGVYSSGSYSTIKSSSIGYNNKNIFLSGDKNNIFVKSVSYSSNHGVEVTGSRNTIYCNDIHNNISNGVEFGGFFNYIEVSNIYSNVIGYNSSGVSNYILFRGTIRDNQDVGMRVGASYNYVMGSEICNNLSHGLSLENSDFNFIEISHIHDNGDNGIRMNNSSASTITVGQNYDNISTDLYLLGSSFNNFASGHHEVIDISNAGCNNNQLVGCHWDTINDSGTATRKDTTVANIEY